MHGPINLRLATIITKPPYTYEHYTNLRIYLKVSCTDRGFRSYLQRAILHKISRRRPYHKSRLFPSKSCKIKISHWSRH